MNQITKEQIMERATQLHNDDGSNIILIAELQLKVEALEKETGESDEEAFHEWLKIRFPHITRVSFPYPYMHAAWLASRKSKA